MKIRIEIDCTPDEARAFFGLPDVKPMQETLMTQLQERLTTNLAAMDPETMFKTWLPANLQGFEQLQRMFWQQMAGGDKPDPGKKG